MSVGARVVIETRVQGQLSAIPCEVVGFSGGNALLMPFAPLEGVRRGCRAVVSSVRAAVRPSQAWLGRVVNAMGEPIDGKGPLPGGPMPYPFRASPPAAHARKRLGAPIDLGVRALNTFITCCHGQRVGIFSGSGVGKSVLLSMLARNVVADVSVIGLIGERGREVQEFLQDDLGDAGLARSVVVVATSDEPALMRRQAAYLTLAIAEYFRDQAQHVLLLMDSVTRFAMAQREVGLAVGEPPTSRGYTPSVFSMLPRLLERTGMGESGSITALYTVLVDGDDFNEPIADAVRGILDGHIILRRSLATANHFPAIDVLESVSRLSREVMAEADLAEVGAARDILALFRKNEDLVNIGAYVKGANAKIDHAVDRQPALMQFLRQNISDRWTRNRSLSELKQLV
jgi:flagellum-specific ATP synthase